MTRIALNGRLVCANAEQAATVARHLPRYIELSRAGPGCVSFDVRGTADPLVWSVSELFTNRVTFDAHQARVRASEWGLATADIERDYVVIAVEGSWPGAVEEG